MNAFLNNRNNASLTGVIDLTANSISLYDQSVSSKPENIKNIFTPISNISVAEPVEVQIDELGQNVITMYQFIGDINDKKLQV